jgi:fructose-bisphosphate aldolase class II
VEFVIPPGATIGARRRFSSPDYGIHASARAFFSNIPCSMDHACAVGSSSNANLARKVIFMPLVTMRQLLDEAAKGGYGVGAFNVNNMEQIQAIMEAARETSSPVIIQASRGARAYTNDLFLWHLMQAATELYPEIPVALHLDHGNSPETCRSAIELGFTSVMMDGSLEEDGKTPSSFEYNVAVTREVVEMAHAKGVTVEGELGTLGGIEDGVGSGEVHLTDPDQAVEFVALTGLDALAVAIGTSHGAYKFARKPDGQVLAMNLIEEIHERLPETHLVMHGSSSVPRELVEIINRYGGKMKESWGVPVEEIQLGIRHGVRKINVDTDSRLAITGAIRKELWEHPEEFDPRSYLKPARAAMQKVIAERMTAFGQAGHAGDYEPIPLEEMRERYASGAIA